MEANRLRLLIVGFGRMGMTINRLAPAAGFEPVGVFDGTDHACGRRIAGVKRIQEVDVAVEFSNRGAAAGNVAQLIELGIPTVTGTTGWNPGDTQLPELAQTKGVGVVQAPNCSIGVNLFLMMVRHAADLMAGHLAFDPWVQEQHHRAKKDRPSGTASLMAEQIRLPRASAPIEVASVRAGSCPGTHTAGWSGEMEVITLNHTARSRDTFASGALVAARWLMGRKGWFTMEDVLTTAQG